MTTWLTAPFESNESDNLILGSVRKGITKFRNNPRFRFRVEATWKYEPDIKGMPDEHTSELMEQVEESIENILAKDPIAVLTGIYTGEGARDYVFYTLSLHIFQKKFNEALADFPELPLSFSAEEDPQWEEYSRVLAIAMADEATDDM